ncbi:PucR family transcriptional regulator [Nonomuraea jiangxiensis]|uniref:PucR family transcriptional regulator n=1 Tax=Nonomuraea jiangxiensis TaxID=633440 RepID=UPI003CCBAFA6
MSARASAGASGGGALDAVVRWVAVSELADPTPFLEGDELLLTTGMRMEGDLSQYVARLVARGVAGLGFGVGVSHEEVPAALIAAADAAGLPLLEVPRETPFIAIGKTVSELLAAEQYEEISRAFAAQGRLTRAALRPEGMHAVIDRLAKEVGGWAALLDETGAPRHATRDARTEAVTAELTRLRTSRHPDTPGKGPSHTGRQPDAPGKGLSHTGHHPDVPDDVRDGRLPESVGGERFPDVGEPRWDDGRGVLDGRLPASLALSGPGEHIVVQPLGGGVRPRGFFAVGARHAFSPVTHTVINAAGSLLTLAVEQGGAQRAAELRVHAAVLELLLAGAEEQARAVLEPLGDRLPEEPFVVLAVPAEAAEALAAHAFTAPLGPGLSARPGLSAGHGSSVGPGASVGSGGSVGSGLPVGTGPRAVALVAERGAERVARVVEGPVGISLPSGWAGLRAAIDQAGRALEAAGRAHPPGATSGGAAGVVRFGELAGQGLLGLLDPDAARAFSAALLAPLTRYGSRADLVESLHAYLESNGHWDAAAQRLGVHRHTLRYRMRRVAELLRRDLDDPGVRAELWLALEAARRR